LSFRIVQPGLNGDLVQLLCCQLWRAAGQRVGVRNEVGVKTKAVTPDQRRPRGGPDVYAA
jgi:hypothetical protein